MAPQRSATDALWYAWRFLLWREDATRDPLRWVSALWGAGKWYAWTVARVSALITHNLFFSLSYVASLCASCLRTITFGRSFASHCYATKDASRSPRICQIWSHIRSWSSPRHLLTVLTTCCVFRRAWLCTSCLRWVDVNPKTITRMMRTNIGIQRYKVIRMLSSSSHHPPSPSRSSGSGRRFF